MRSYSLKIPVLLLFILTSCGGSGEETSRTEPEKQVSSKSDTESPPPTSQDAPPAKPLSAVTAPRESGRDALAHFGKLRLAKLETGTPRLVPNPSPQSVILIVIDTLNAGHLSSYGYHRKTTPRIDALARNGLLFSNQVSNSSWTRPSYTTIITGLPKSKHKVELGGGLKMDTTTLAERFREKGFKTAAFVGNPLVREIWGFGQGYQLYRDTHSYDKAFPFDGVLVDDAIEWLDTVGDDKHFTTLFMTAPHAPYRPPRSRRHFLDTVPAGPVNEYPFREYKSPLKRNEHARIVAAYDDEVAYADHQVGRIVDYLKQKKRGDKTTIVVTADHGEMLGEHNCYGHGYHMWEENLRVPLVIKSRNLAVTGKHDDSPHTHIDIAPSLLALAGINDIPKTLPGISLFDTTGAEMDRIRMSMYDAHDIRRQAVRDNRYKLVHYDKIAEAAFEKLNSLRTQIPHADPKDLPSLTASLEGEIYALYDLYDDPEETKNIFESLKDDHRIRPLLETLLEHLNDKGDEVGKMSDELIEALKNAGYFVSGDD